MELVERGTTMPITFASPGRSAPSMNLEASMNPMLPPNRLYVPGSRAFQEAMERGILHTSRPPSPSQDLSSSLAHEDGGAPSSSSDRPFVCSSSSSFVEVVEVKQDATWEGWNVSSMRGDVTPSPPLETSSTNLAGTNGACDEADNLFIDQELVSSSCYATATADTASMDSTGGGTESGGGGGMESSCLDEIVGHDEAKLRIQEVLLSLSPRFAAIMTGIRALPPSILLYGPPGCGKTKLARAIAGEARAAFLQVAPSDVMSKFVGESEGQMREIFSQAWDLAGQADSHCCVMFFDEIDALGHARGSGGGGEASGGGVGEGGGCSRRVIVELLLQLTQWSEQTKERQTVWTHRPAPPCDDAMDDDSLPNSGSDGSPNRIIVVAATNRFEDCDQALLRRFGIHLHIGLPSARHRRVIVQHLLSDVSHVLTSRDLREVASRTNGWSGSDLESLTREAAMTPVRECIQRANRIRKSLQSERSTHGDGHSSAFSVMHYLESDVESLRPVEIQDFLHAIEFFRSTGTTNNNSNEYCQSDEDD